MNRLRVGIDARLVSGMWGGIEQVIIGLAQGLSQLDDGDEEYHFLAYSDSIEWLLPYLHGPSKVLMESPMPLQIRLMQSRLIRPVLPLTRQAWYRWQASAGRRALARSSGAIERAGIDVMHFTIQSAFLTTVPSIYHPHDLQHLHLPQYFTPQQRKVREVTYRVFCEQARLVVVTSSWGKRDLIGHYNLPTDKVQVIPWAPVLGAYPEPSDEDLRAVQRKFALPSAFIFYPAQTWPHKNHNALLEALAILRDRNGLVVPLVSSGHRNEFFPQIERYARELGLLESARFLEFVSPLELRSLYKLCRAVVIPTRFEAGSFPLWEAFLAEVPAACSNVTTLPEQAGDAALIFDPGDTKAIADAVLHLWTDETLRRRLVRRGAENVARFTWDRTARTFRAYYRQIAGRSLTSQDHALLAAPPLL